MHDGSHLLPLLEKTRGGKEKGRERERKKAANPEPRISSYPLFNFVLGKGNKGKGERRRKEKPTLHTPLPSSREPEFSATLEKGERGGVGTFVILG